METATVDLLRTEISPKGSGGKWLLGKMVPRGGTPEPLRHLHLTKSHFWFPALTATDLTI